MKEGVRVDERYRSLLHKVARRGYPEWIFTVGALMESMGPQAADWFETRTAAIVFSECWPLGADLVLTKGIPSKVAALVRLAGKQKNRDATGLGLLAYALEKGDASAAEELPDGKPLRWLTRALRRPSGFWSWAAKHAAAGDQSNLIQKALRSRDAGRPHDRAVSIAAAYLALTTRPPDIRAAPAPDEGFPFWVVFDRHTTEGKRALRDVARDLHIPLHQLEWSLFYYEGSRTNAEAESPWWRAYCRWHFRRNDLQPEESHLLWEPAREQMIQALAEDGQRLQSELYRWKLAHPEVIENLRRRVDLFNANLKTIRSGQPDLF
jgi:hypothetical protein